MNPIRARVRLFLPLLALLAFCMPAAAEVYRCGSGGQLTYTDQPCAAGERLDLPPPVTVAPEDGSLARSRERRIEEGRQRRDAADAAWLRGHEVATDKAEAIRGARLAGVAIAGMTAADVRQALGEPDKVTAGDGGERWTYKLDDGGRQVVSFRAGEVTTVAISEPTRRKRR